MHPTLHIIANCTNRKRALVPDSLRLRAIPPGTIEERVRSWWHRLTYHRGRGIRAVDLYAGGHWAAVKDLRILAERAGLKHDLWAISAGYGLVSARAFIHPYSATFAGSQPDAVTAHTTDEKSRTELIQTWWNKLCDFSSSSAAEEFKSFSSLIQERRHDYFLLIASPDYLVAIEQDLLDAVPRLADHQKLIIVSSRPGATQNSLNNYLVPSDARLQSRVGGTRGALHARVAAMILRNLETWGFDAATVRNKLESIIARSPLLPKYDRSPTSDDDVRDFIQESLNQASQASFTTLLRSLRDRGRACEQSRFKHLYYQVKESNGEG